MIQCLVTLLCRGHFLLTPGLGRSLFRHTYNFRVESWLLVSLTQAIQTMGSSSSSPLLQPDYSCMWMLSRCLHWQSWCSCPEHSLSRFGACFNRALFSGPAATSMGSACPHLCLFLLGQSQVDTKPVLKFIRSDSFHKKMDSEKIAQFAKATWRINGTWGLAPVLLDCDTSIPSYYAEMRPQRVLFSPALSCQRGAVCQRPLS